MLTIDNLQKIKKMGVVSGRRSEVKTGFFRGERNNVHN